MFRAQSNIFDDVVTKATDENLTSENWEYILVRAFCSTALGGSLDGGRLSSLLTTKSEPFTMTASHRASYLS
jgi:hypothetical protein